MSATAFYDRLLDWCSERGQGTLQAFADTHRWLRHATDGGGEDWSLSAYKLQVLGHIELVWRGEPRWAVAPPVVSVLDRSGGNALLVGGRPRWLMSRLEALPEDPNPVVQELAQRVVLDEPREQPRKDGPPAIYLTARSDDDIRMLCGALGIQFEQRLAARLRDALPSLDSYIDMGWGAPMPPGFAPRRFDLRAPKRWREVDNTDDAGAYEFTRYGPPRYFFIDGADRAEVEKWIAVYAELRRTTRDVLFYRHESRTLLTPARLPLPLLYARCAVLRTGMLPRYLPDPPPGMDQDLGPALEYQNMTPKLASAIATAVGQHLRTMRY
jgi:hypothetical protein